MFPFLINYLLLKTGNKSCRINLCPYSKKKFTFGSFESVFYGLLVSLDKRNLTSKAKLIQNKNIFEITSV